MEIERKWLYPAEDFALLSKGRTIVNFTQSYLSISPEVRIRKREEKGDCTYKLCIKGNGTISRQEIEKELTEQEYIELLGIAGGKCIDKKYVSVFLPTGEELVAGAVDDGKLYYAEIEFPTIEEANAFQVPDFMKEWKDVTYEPYYKMKNYFKRKFLVG